MKRTELLLLMLQVPLDFLLLILASVSAYYLRFSAWAQDLKPILFDLSLIEFIQVATPVALAWVVIFALAGLYNTGSNRKLAGDLTRVVFAASTGFAAITIYVFFTLQKFDSRFLVLAGWILAMIYVCAGRILMNGLKNS